MAEPTIDDLARTEGKAEWIGGRIVRYPPFGRCTGRIVGRIVRHLDEHARAFGRGEAFSATVGFVVSPLRSGRRSFCPDTSYFAGPFAGDPMRLLHGPPTFAVEVRSEGDVGPAAEAAMAAKRADYFAAGTLAVWDVDPEAEVIRVYRAGDPESPAVYRRGDTAEAEPAVPGWRVAVDLLFGPATG